MSKILVIDDEPGLREVVRMSLQAEGYAVIEAENGRQGVELARSHCPDLVLCDIAMPGLDGYGTLEALRQHTATAALPFILMTGRPNPDGMRHGMELGADDYLPKPFRIEQLLAAVRARLDKESKVRARAEAQLNELRSSISLTLPQELLAPLGSILGFADLLAADGHEMAPDEITSIGQTIRASAKRLHRTIKDFLLLAQLYAQDASHPALLAGGEVLDLAPWARDLAQAQARAAGREADTIIELQPVSARVGQEYLGKAIAELLDNAFKFSAPGTPVRIDLRPEGSNAILRISDRGEGMKPEHVARIGAHMQFERRLHEQRGAGLGLAIAKRVAELHGGVLGVSSEPGAGTSVEIRLPAASPAASRS